MRNKLFTLPLLSLSLSVSLLGCGSQGASGSRMAIGGSGEGPPRSLTILSTARLDVAPDSACVRLTFSEERARMVDAHTAVRAHRARFLAAVEDLGVEVEEGATLYAPAYDTGPGPRRLRGYTATISLNVHTREPDRVPEIIERAGDGLHGVEVEHYAQDIAQHRERVRQMAIEAAQRKARQLASGFEVELGEVLSLEEGHATTARPGAYLANFVANEAGSAGADGDRDRGPAPPGSIPLSMSLHVTFALGG